MNSKQKLIKYKKRTGFDLIKVSEHPKMRCKEMY